MWSIKHTCKIIYKFQTPVDYFKSTTGCTVTKKLHLNEHSLLICEFSEIINFCNIFQQLLADICDAEQISLSAIHLPGEKDTAAHNLAHSNVEEFKAIVPNCFEKPKKVKKVEFCLPLPDHDIRTEAGTISYRSLSMEHLSDSTRSRLEKKISEAMKRVSNNHKQSCDSSKNKLDSS